MTTDTFARGICVAVDVESYSQRIESEQADVQSDLRHLLLTAAVREGIATDAWSIQEQGDGVLVLAPLDGSEPRYVDALVRRLVTDLSRYNRQRLRESRLRLRVAIHQGVAYPGKNGFVGDAVVLVCRLRDSGVCKRVLAESESDLVLVLSDATYTDLVAPENTSFSPDDFTLVSVEEAKVSTKAWFWAPSGRDSETLKQARQRKNGATKPADRKPTVKQRAQTITNIDRFKTDTAYLGTVVRPRRRDDDDD